MPEVQKWAFQTYGGEKLVVEVGDTLVDATGWAFEVAAIKSVLGPPDKDSGFQLRGQVTNGSPRRYALRYSETGKDWHSGLGIRHALRMGLVWPVMRRKDRSQNPLGRLRAIMGGE